MTILLLNIQRKNAFEIDDSSLSIENSEQGVVGDVRVNRKRIVDKEGSSQIRHTRTFQIYTIDNSNYSPIDTVGANSQDFFPGLSEEF